MEEDRGLRRGSGCSGEGGGHTVVGGTRLCKALKVRIHRESVKDRILLF